MGQWTERQEMVFQDLKHMLVTAPVLVYPDFSRPFVVITDASDVAVGAVLQQDDECGDRHAVAYFSRKLKGAEVNWTTTEKEAIAQVLALKEWRCFLEGSTFLLQTDHHPLIFLQSQPELSRMQARWLEFLQQFDFKVQHIPGKDNAVADALSRMKMNALTVSELQHRVDWIQQVRRALMTDEIARQAQVELTKDGSQVWSEQNKLLYWRRRLYIPDVPQLRQQLVREAHMAPSAGHPGVHRTVQHLSRSYYWPGLRQDVKTLVSQCDVRIKAPRVKPGGLLQPLPVPTQPWKQICLDFITGLPITKRGYTAALVFSDKLTRMIRIAPTVEGCTAEDAAELFMMHVYRFHGLPRSIISDRDTRCTSHFWKAIDEALGIHICLSTAYHPQTDGTSEKANQIVEDILRAHCSSHQADWDQYLHFTEFAFNDSVNTSTGFTPFFLNAGFHPDTLLSACLPTIQDTPAADSYSYRHRRDVEFRSGDFVLLSTKYLDVPGHLTRKLSERFIGPYRILERIGQIAYRLALPPHLHMHNVFHVCLLKAYNGTPPTRPPPDIIQGHEEFEVQGILQHRYRRRKLEFLVLWTGYPPSDLGASYCFLTSWPDSSRICTTSSVLVILAAFFTPGELY